MKKRILWLLSFLCGISLLTMFYSAWRYVHFAEHTMALIRAEIGADNPALGYPFKSTVEGVVTSHPVLSWAEHKKLVELFAPQEHERVTAALESLKEKKEILLSKVTDIHGHIVDIYLTHQADGIHGLLFFPDELKRVNAGHERHALIFLSLGIMGFICVLLLLLGTCLIRDHNRWWFIVFLLSTVICIELFYLWSLRYTIGFQEEYQNVPFITQTQNAHFLRTLEDASGRQFAVVPTGILIERMQFSPRGNSVYPGLYITGYVWQKYDKKADAHLERGFIISNAQTITTTLLAQNSTDTHESICWAFSAVLYQRFNPRLYPFDHRHLVINLLHKNFEKNVVLVPDLDSYELTNPLTLPGISFKNIAYWSVRSSFFNLQQRSLGTALGFQEFASAHVPYLQFFITAERKIGGDFLMYLVTLALIFIIVFILLLAFLKQEVFKELVGFSTIGVLSVCCSLLFVLITSEIDLRHALITEGIVYLEFIYFICYLTILGVITNGILFATKTDFMLIQFENNLVCKLLYWPAVLLSIVLVTAYAIY